MYSSVVPGWSRTTSQKASISRRSALRDEIGLPSPSEWVRDCDEEKPSPPASSDSESSRLISAISSSEATSAPRSEPITKRRSAQCPTRKPGVDAEASFEAVEVLVEARPVPRETVLERDQRHALDLGHHPADVVVVLLLDRGEGEPAVAADDGGDPVEVGRRRGRVPEQLGVVVGVRVDDPRRHHQALGVELGGPAVGDLADRHDPAVLHADVGPPGGASGAVDDPAVADDVVEHGLRPLLTRVVCPRADLAGARVVGPGADRASAYGRAVALHPNGLLHLKAVICTKNPVDSLSATKDRRWHRRRSTGLPRSLDRVRRGPGAGGGGRGRGSRPNWSRRPGSRSCWRLDHLSGDPPATAEARSGGSTLDPGLRGPPLCTSITAQPGLRVQSPERWRWIEGLAGGFSTQAAFLRFWVSAPRARAARGACEISSGGGVPHVPGQSEAGSLSSTPVVSVSTSGTGWADPWLARPQGPRPHGLPSRGNPDPCNPGGTWPPPSHYDPVTQGDVSSWRRAAATLHTASRVSDQSVIGAPK